MAKKEVPEDEGVSQEWLASYADAMTLLLAFFIMMVAFALIDEGKYFDFKVGVIAALGIPDPLTDNTDSILSEGTGISPEVGLTPITKSSEAVEAQVELREKLEEAGLITPENADQLRELLEQEFFYAGAADYVEVGIDERGVYIRFDGRVLFPSGEATLDEDGLILLATAADVLQIVENPLEVEGHTDSQPTNGGRWPSNWELSTARASRVVRWMIDPGSLPPTRMTAVGLADTRPRANNNTAEGRQENRRVEIVTRVVQNVVPPSDPVSDGGQPDEGELATDPAPDPDVGTDGDPGGAQPTDTEAENETGSEADGETASGSTANIADDNPVDLEEITTIDPIGDPIGLAANAEADSTDAGDSPGE